MLNWCFCQPASPIPKPSPANYQSSMQPVQKKSIAYYVLISCLTLIGCGMLLPLASQFSFYDGWVFVRYGRGAFGFLLWMFAIEVIALSMFLILGFLAIKRRLQGRYYLWSMLSGAIAIFFILLLFSYHSYGESISSSDSAENSLWMHLVQPFFFGITFILGIMALLFFWRRHVFQAKR